MPKRLVNRRKYRSVLRAVHATPWAIEHSKLEAIRELLELRAGGQQFTAEEIQQRIGVQAEPPEYQVIGGVAVLPLAGVLAPKMNMMMRYSGGTSLSTFALKLRDAVENPNVRAIVIDTDSPGGSVQMTAETAELIFKARATKRIVAIANTDACSAAYWIASAAHELCGTVGCTVGSIGVLTIHTESSEADKKYGVGNTVIKAGKYKADGNSVEPLSDQARETIQARVDTWYQMFVAAVAKHRGVSTERVLEDYGQGRVVVGRDAVEAGLVDRIATPEQILRELGADATPRVFSVGGGGAMRPIAQALEQQAMNEIRDRLVALGLVTADANDGQAQIALRAWFAAHGKQVPSDQAQILAALKVPPNQNGAPAPPAVPPATTAPATSAVDQAAINAVMQAERTRVREIRAMGQLMAASGVEPAVIEAAIEEGLTIEQAKTRIFDALAKANKPVQITPGESSRDVTMAAIEGALEYRTTAGIPGVEPPKLTEAARSLRYKPFLQICAIGLKSMGVRGVDEMDPKSLASLALNSDNPQALWAASGTTSYNTTGSLPALFANLQGKSLERAFEQAPVTFRDWCVQGPSVPDFLPKYLIQIAGFGNLPEVAENQDYEPSKLSDQKEWYQVGKFGDTIPLTFEMIVNDQLDALSRIPAEKGMASARTLNDLCYEVLLSNPVMADGVTCFHATHNNLIDTGSGGPPTIAALGTMRQKLRAQRGLDGKSRLRLPLKHVLVPAALETVTERLLLSPSDASQANPGVVNVFQNRLHPMSEALLDDSSQVTWYGIADPAVIRGMVYAFLQGHETPKTESWWDPKNDTRWFKITHVFCALVANWRALQKNAGA